MIMMEEGRNLAATKPPNHNTATPPNIERVADFEIFHFSDWLGLRCTVGLKNLRYHLFIKTKA